MPRPSEVENFLFEHPEVADAAVVGLPSQRWGQMVAAAVVSRRSALTAETLDQFCRTSPQLASFKCPRHYFFINELPASPIVATTQQGQIDLFRALKTELANAGSEVKLIVDEWCNTLEDVKLFADAGVVDYIQVKTPDLGGINNTIEALLYCRQASVGAYCGGSANETDQSARVCAQIALACQADLLMCKPGQGVDEGLLILTNEMRRTLALIAAGAN